MSPKRLHVLARDQRRRVTLIVVMLSLAGVVALAHAGPLDGHIGDTAAMCLAVAAVGAGSLLSGTWAVGATLGGALIRLPSHAPRLGVPRPLPLARARPGPAVLQVFRR